MTTQNQFFPGRTVFFYNVTSQYHGGKNKMYSNRRWTHNFFSFFFFDWTLIFLLTYFLEALLVDTRACAPAPDTM